MCREGDLLDTDRWPGNRGDSASKREAYLKQAGISCELQQERTRCASGVSVVHSRSRARMRLSRGVVGQEKGIDPNPSFFTG